MKIHDKPRVKFCWHCSRKLWGRHHKILIIEGHKRILHESCAKIFYDNKDDATVAYEITCEMISR